MAKDKKRVSKRAATAPTAKDRKLYDRKSRRLDELEDEIKEEQLEIDEVAKEFDAELSKANRPHLSAIEANAKQYRGAFEAAVEERKKRQAGRIQEVQKLSRELRKLTRKIWGDDGDDEKPAEDDEGGAKVHTLPTKGNDSVDSGGNGEAVDDKPRSPAELLEKYKRDSDD